ncbi:MAG: response regulator [bacterium]|nr:response regulator [bacterium]
MALIRKNGQWIESQRFNSISQEIRHIAEDKKGHLWLSTSTKDVLKVDFTTDSNQPIVTPYGTSHGLPEGQVYVSAAAGHVLFATGKGIFQFDEKKKVFIPDSILGTEFAGGQDSKPVSRITEDKNKNIWFHSESRNYQAIPGTGKSFSIRSVPFRRIPTIQVNAIYPDPEGKITWFASSDGIIRYDTTAKKKYDFDFLTLIRKVTANGNLIFDGYKTKAGKASEDLFPIIDYKAGKNFHFEFAAPFFEAENKTQYRYLLEGHDDDWSDWRSETNKDFTTLDFGTYRFLVQAKNVYGQFSRKGMFQFKILPPWYRTWWAFLLYGIGFFLLMFLVVKWLSGKLEREKKILDHTVKERTIQLNEKNQQLEKQTLKLKDQSEKLKEMDKVKSRFFTNMSHEFRTPLTLIMGPMEQMLSGNRDNEQKNKLKMMMRNSQRVLTLINQLLDLSRFDSGKMTLSAAPQNIVSFLKGIVASFLELAKSNKLDLEFCPEEEEISLYFDAQKMEEVMYNLLINAVKFTPAGGKITISVSIDQEEALKEGKGVPGYVKISVRDTGIGIPQEEFTHIFDRFYQARSLTEKTHKGTGIGLALTREIVVLHHGKIEVHSSEGKGTEFVILFPMGKEHLTPAEITAAPQTPFAHERGKEIETLYMTAEEQSDECVENQTDTVKKDKTEEQELEKNVILVVEDNADVRTFIRGPLEALYTVVETSDGKEGIKKAKEIIPDLIVSDIMMPKADGYQLCRDLKKDIATSHIPIILLTAKASDESIIQGLETGADDYVTKPFNTKMLLSRIKNLIDLRRQLQLNIQREKMLLPPEISVSSQDEEFLKEFQDIIEKNLSEEDFNVDRLSEKLFMGRSTLFRKVQALTGETPNQFILSYRLERGAQLLRENFGNVTEVAMEVGFSSSTYFSTCFKEKFHQSPSAYLASQGPGKSK